MEAEKETSHHPCLASLDAKHEHMFLVPTKRIHEVQDVSHFLTSRAYGDLMTFLLQLNRALFPQKVKTNDQNPEVRVWQLGMSRYNFSDTVKRLQRLLNQIEALIDEIPPDEGPRRFGNVSFRKWYQRVESSASELLQDHLPSSSIKSTPSGSSIPEEILPYFLGSFGSAQRLDYGSGHELSFFAFLGCIWKLGGFENQPSASEAPSFNEDDQSRGIVLGILADYFRLIRRLIKTYTLEPAGSHGVWGLDDHSFLPYIFGSAQNGPPISESDRTPTEGSRKGAPNPADVAKASIVEQHRDQDLYFGAIGFIYDVKKGPFWEHSPMLYDISGVQAGWGKINKGMIKMYAAEVLGKFPVVQHFPFGSLFSWETDPHAPAPASNVHTSSHAKPPPLSGMSQPAPPPPSAPSRGPEAHSQDPAGAAGTRAPWAAARSPASGGLGATAAPWATGRSSGRTTTSTDGASGRLPPPPSTRAPWAKPPGP